MSARDPLPRAIPTRYLGIDFRSQLEARWACMWTLLGIHFEYEPGIYLDGYVPDFLIDCELHAGPARAATRPTLVEVRPLWNVEEYRAPIDKIALSGWTGAAMVVGATVRSHRLFAEPEFWCGYGHPEVRPDHADPSSLDWFRVGYSKDGPGAGQFCLGGSFDLTNVWRESGNRVKWSPHR